MSPWFFNVYMDGVVREVNVNVLGKGLELLNRMVTVFFRTTLPCSGGYHMER